MLKTRTQARAPWLPAHRQRGMMMIEALAAIVIVMLGILGIAGLTAKSVTSAGHAQYRTEAGMYAEQIVQMISLKVDRSSPQNLTDSLLALQHQANGNGLCNFSGAEIPDTEPELVNTLKAARGDTGVGGYVHGLPGAEAAGQQILVNTGNNNQVTVTLCWQGPGDKAKRSYQLQAYVH